ncbi:AraC family transcriptional regulator [Salipaludibacillus sp. CF4.18]|uniref:AraC family transcriptional regulator n=1 Tax=Salipaludibacillus sp. CF4.18 TaxID=3373081 RepID=UPI003EE5C838
MFFDTYEGLPYESIGFRSNENLETAVDISVIGMEKTKSEDYNWHGLERKEKRNFVFQYTLSGEGALTINGKTHGLKEGQAFMVEIPSRHRYFLPSTSKEWEFFYLTLKGDVASECWGNITSRHGRVLNIARNSELVDKFFEIYKQAIDKDLVDSYFSSSQAYSFLMEVYRYFKQVKSPEQIPENITGAINYMNKNYALPLSMEEVADAANMSRYYFIKRFKEVTDMTPGQYLTKKRMEKSLELLVQTELTMKDIAVNVGYANDNYFNKAFRKTVGIPPGEFRKNKGRIPFDRLVIR